MVPNSDVINEMKARGLLERFQVAVAGLARVPPRSLATSVTDNRYTDDGTALGSTDIQSGGEM